MYLWRKKKKTAHSGLKAPPRSLYVRKSPDRGSLRLTKSKFLPRCQNPQFCGFAPRGKLVGECLPQTLLWRLAPLIPAALMRQERRSRPTSRWTTCGTRRTPPIPGFMTACFPCASRYALPATTSGRKLRSGKWRA